ncbi:MAG TPA: CocE/NonD family hydrolase C-terminal non-catalytic domain-containing protein, partial [Candidatus Eisenbacteria bacterium]|nr:CocE/NonD family hydrolase C-terminal non-catalytic domain-containing protein [Candidatus Eisenbacteria bacterium]
GHAAPAAPQAVEDDRLHEQIAFLDRFLQPGASATARGPAVVYWRRDPRAVVPGDAYRYPDGSWTRLTSPSWPPPGISDSTLQLGSDGTAATSGAPSGAEPLAPFNADPANDPVAAAAFSSTPVGTSPIPRQVPTLAIPGFLGGFQTAPFAADRELSGSPRANLSWTPLSPDTQLIVKLLDRAPDGTLTLLSRGVTGLRGAAPGMTRQVAVPMNAISALIPAGHSLVAWVTAADASFYEPYVPSLGGILQAGPGSTLAIPLGSPR